MRGVLKLAATLLLAAGALPTLAQTQLPVSQGEPFLHELTGITFPSAVFDVPRAQVLDFGNSQYDVSANYMTEEQDLVISIYAYRAGFTNIPVNFDVALSAITEHGQYTPDEAANLAPVIFTPEGHTESDSAFVTFDATPGGRFEAGGLALVPHGQWIVKVRISSNRHTREELAELITAVVDEIELPVPPSGSGEAYVVTACEQPLNLQLGKVIEPEPAELIAQTILLTSVIEASDDTDSDAIFPTVQWCRDPDYPDMNIYRPVSSAGGYAMLLSDSGTALRVGLPAGGISEFLLARERGVIGVTFADSNGSTLVALVDGLPDPREVGQLLQGYPPLARSDRAGNIAILREPPAAR